MPPPKSRRGVSNEEYFTLGNMALDTLKGLADHALVSGRGEVIDLTKLYVDSATRQIALNGGVYNGYPDPGGQLEATVAAARHHVLAVNALGELNASLFSRQPQGTDLLSYSAHQLYANPETVIRMFGTLHQRRIYSSIHANFEREALKKSPGR